MKKSFYRHVMLDSVHVCPVPGEARDEEWNGKLRQGKRKGEGFHMFDEKPMERYGQPDVVLKTGGLRTGLTLSHGWRRGSGFAGPCTIQGMGALVVGVMRSETDLLTLNWPDTMRRGRITAHESGQVAR